MYFYLELIWILGPSETFDKDSIYNMQACCCFIPIHWFGADFFRQHTQFLCPSLSDTFDRKCIEHPAAYSAVSAIVAPRK